jgi:hypothetical protein
MRPHKLSAPEREIAVRRYQEGLRNRPSVICAELGIDQQTLRNYVRAALPGCDNSCGRCGATPSRCTCLKPAANE